MTLDETLSYLNRTTDIGWEYEGPVPKGWRFKATSETGATTSALFLAGRKPSDKDFRQRVSLVESYFIWARRKA